MDVFREKKLKYLKSQRACPQSSPVVEEVKQEPQTYEAFHENSVQHRLSEREIERIKEAQNSFNSFSKQYNNTPLCPIPLNLSSLQAAFPSWSNFRPWAMEEMKVKQKESDDKALDLSMASSSSSKSGLLLSTATSLVHIHCKGKLDK